MIYTLYIFVGLKANLFSMSIDFTDLKSCNDAIESAKTNYGKKTHEMAAELKCVKNENINEKYVQITGSRPSGIR